MMDNCLPEHGPHNRHFWFAKHLKEQGYNPVVFVASRERGSAIQMIEDDAPFKVDDSYGFPFVYIRIKDYGESMKKRILAIFEFHKRLNRYANTFAEMYGKPDVVLGSNGYPLSPWLANKLAKKYGAASICEVCDLWPLSLEVYGIIGRGGLIAKAMYVLERKNYENADAIVFSMEGGCRYIQDHGWDLEHGGRIDLKKVHHINNGVDLEAFDANLANRCVALTASEESVPKIIYAGSMQKINNVGYLVDAAACLADEPFQFIFYGDGEDAAYLREKVASKGLENVSLPGAIDKRDIPAALDQATLLLMYSLPEEEISRYGMSQNKLFDYLASGKPVLSNLPSEYSVICRYNCGIERTFSDSADFAAQIAEMVSDKDSMKQWGTNARKTAELYSFVSHTNHLIGIIEEITKEEK
ncbi:MAG: glycosyltransferase family 4 protein [Adlercreutzia sp.]|nr:glycosyltransferase family 4 protein [Adlercreutzia sp.]